MYLSGIDLSQATLDAISARFNNKAGNLNFDDFLQIVCRIYSVKGACTIRLSQHFVVFVVFILHPLLSFCVYKCCSNKPKRAILQGKPCLKKKKKKKTCNEFI